MTTFGDDDLRRLKSSAHAHEKMCSDDIPISPQEMKALLARLEASERIHAIPHRCHKCGVLQKITGKFVEAWRKAAAVK